MNNINYEYFVFGIDDNPKYFFDWCLKNNLYKEDAENFKSRLKRNFLFENEYQGASFVIAYEDDNPIGVLMLNHHLNEVGKVLETQGGLLHIDAYRRKNPWQKKLDFKFIYLGFTSFFVKEDFRNKGIAKEMLSILEKNEVKRISNSEVNIENAYFIVTARELAENIVRNSKTIIPTIYRPNNTNYIQEISYLSYKIFFEEMKINKLTDVLTLRDNRKINFKI